MSTNLVVIVSVILLVLVVVMKAYNVYNALLLLQQDSCVADSRPIFFTPVPNTLAKSDYRGEK